MADVVVNITPPAPINLAYTQGGAVGPQGPQGIVGPANKLVIGTVASGTTPAASLSAQTVSGTNASQTLSFVLQKGDTGSQGIQGIQGIQGVAGPANKLSIGTVVSGADAAATLSAQTVSGTNASQVLSLTLPQGATGIQGPQGIVGPAGPANSLSIGTVVSDSTASSATITGTAPSQVLSLVLQKGDKGIQGDAGPYTVLKVGTVATGAAGTDAIINTVSAGGTVTLNFTIPKGADGTSNLSDETPQPLGVASTGSALRAARADHVHQTPVISFGNLVGVPAQFAPTSHTHTLSEVSSLQAALDSKQPSGNYATLVNGTVPSSQLPGFVDDVIEYSTLSAFPATNEVGKLFVAIDTRKLYRWSGTGYVEIASSPGSTDAITEGTNNLYFTTARASAASPVQSVNGKTGAVVIEAAGIAWSAAPTATTTVTKAGQISYDSNYLYVSTDANQWRRAGLEDWTTPTISISAQPSNQTAVSGSVTFTVTATASQNAELLYQWQRQAKGTGDFLNIATGLSATLSLTELSYAANNGDKYRVVITTGAAGTGGTAVNGWLPAVVVELTPTATLTSGVATLTVSAELSIIAQPQNVNLTVGTDASFSVNATTPGTSIEYQWQQTSDGTNWTNVSGATSSSYAISGVTETGNGGYKYRCVVSSTGYTTQTSNAATLNVAPITVSTQPTNKTGTPVAGTTPNYTASFSSSAISPAGVPSLQWEVSADGGTTYSDVSGQTSSALSLTGLTSADSGKKYRAKFVKSGWNVVRSNAATLTVPTDTIAVSTQPSNTTASVSSYSAASSNLPSGAWNAVSYVNGKWFATPSDQLGGDYIATSDDGATWTKRLAVLPYAGRWSKVLYGNNIYLTFLTDFGPAGTWCATSSDGLAWTARQISSTSGHCSTAHNFITGGGGWFIASNGSSGSNSRLVQSSNGISWQTISPNQFLNVPASNFTQSSDGSSLMMWSPNYSDTAIASVSSSGVGAFTSTGGIGNSPMHVIHDGSKFVMVTLYSVAYGYTNCAYYTSGINWVTGTFLASFYHIVYQSSLSRYVAVTSVGIATSNDSVNWVLRQSGTGAVASDRVVITSSGVAATINGVVYTSTDAITWTQRAFSGYVLSQAGTRVFTVNNQLGTLPTSVSAITPGGNTSASFTAAASTVFGSPAIQWQKSVDGGANWLNISSATSSPLLLTPVTADNGAKYRAVFTKDTYTTVNSNAATLTVA
jgi:hypothetical protein